MKNERRTAAAAFFGVLLLDLCWRSRFYNFDGVACAIAVELSDFKHLAHGNHLAYGLMAWLFDRTWRLLGWRGEALLPLQVLNALLGAAGAASLASFLRRAGRSEREALLGAAALAVCHAWWFWSLEAQVYMLGAFFAALAAGEALANPPRPLRIGLWQACAALGHIGHLAALPALAWHVWRERGRRAAAALLLACASVIAASYAAAGIWAVRPHDTQELKLWLLGSAALEPHRGFHWHSAPPLQALRSWLLMTPRLFVEFAGRSGLTWLAGFLLAALALMAVANGLRRDPHRRFWLMWLSGYAVLYLSWEPSTMVYRVSDLIAFSALAVAGLQSLAPRARAAALSAWILAAGSYNAAYVIRPAADPSANLDLTEANLAAAMVSENAWLIASGRMEIYYPYFAHRRALSLRYSPTPPALFSRLDGLNSSQEPVYVTNRRLELSGRRADLEQYGLELSGDNGALRLYRVKRKANPAAKDGKN